MSLGEQINAFNFERPQVRLSLRPTEISVRQRRLVRAVGNIVRQVVGQLVRFSCR